MERCTGVRNETTCIYDERDYFFILLKLRNIATNTEQQNLSKQLFTCANLVSLDYTVLGEYFRNKADKVSCVSGNMAVFSQFHGNRNYHANIDWIFFVRILVIKF